MNNKKMILANIGSGSSYLPDIAEMLIERRDTMQVAEWRLMDIDDYRLNCTGKYVKKMFEEGVYVNPVIAPACVEGECLLRTTLMATHTEPIIDEAVQIIARVLQEGAPQM